MADTQEGTDASSIKPVSSLRSRFENLGKDGSLVPASTVFLRPNSLSAGSPAANGRPSTSGGESVGSELRGVDKEAQQLVLPRKRRPTPPRSRPHSMMSIAPSEISPLHITVDSPNSPGRPSPGRSTFVDRRMPTSTSPARPLTFNRSHPDSPTKAHARTISRAATPGLESRMNALMQPSDPRIPLTERASSMRPPTPEIASRSQPVGVPPPINRAGKPNVPKKPPAFSKKPEGLSVPEPAAELTDQSASPFSTPPSSGRNSPTLHKASTSDRAREGTDASFVSRLRGDSDASFVERLRSDSDASSVKRVRGESEASFAARSRAQSNASFVEPSSLPEAHQLWYGPPPTHHSAAVRREQHANGIPNVPALPTRYRNVASRERTAAGDLPEDRPGLPARPEVQTRSGRATPTPVRSGRTSPLKNHFSASSSTEGLRKASVSETQTSQRIPAARPAQSSALSQGFERTMPSPASSTAHIAPTVPAPRRSVDRRREMPGPTSAATNGPSRTDVADTPPLEPSEGQPVGLSDYPDSSQTSRRSPRYGKRPWQIPTHHDTRTFAVCGEYVCTTGHHTKVWSLHTGEQLLDMPHNEIIKVSSLVFKPCPNNNDEGKRIWLGTSVGDIHEVDVPSQSIVKTRTNAHTRRDIIRMFRYASELWTLDDGGDLNVWKPDHKSMPSLDSQYNNFRVPRGHTFSIALGSHLWIATGKDIRVFAPSTRSATDFQLLRTPLSQPGTGDIHSGATVSEKPHLVYFGHQDGKVSIYNRNDFSCTSVVNVSMYRLSSLAGVGDYLWAGFSTGMIYVYDTSTTPWRVKKDWQAHEKQICGISADRSAIWKLDKLQVVTLGTDNLLKLWDGMLEEDWLESRMQEYDGEYCSFREITAAVLTWNAGASKPQYLSNSKGENNFFRDYITNREPPDIFVFGLQELVDLEDKKLTAKSLFKSKKRDANEQEHIGHQYRAWRDYLTKCIDEYMPADRTYALLHTASLVGLFTCIFVSTPLRPRIKHVHSAEVKRGMGGIHGNKGALVMRMVLDDSSLCFINCHLAAGQTQTINRNNDIAAILESEVLPSYPLNVDNTAQHADVFTSGGDGSMILDHEICILNGDLNYRIDTMGRDTVIKHINKNDLQRLLERDQLLLSRKKNPGFRLRAFKESEIRFPPTYKYNVQSDEYDTSEKRRSPAWCDRILYRGLGKVKMEEYRRWEVRVSDHRPVSGRLRLRVKTVDQARRQQVWKLCAKEFEAVRGKVARAVQLQYLTDVLGLSPKDAASSLKH